jgi:hypothetical protein
LSKTWKKGREKTGSFTQPDPGKEHSRQREYQCKGPVANKRPSCPRNSKEARNKQEETERHEDRSIGATRTLALSQVREGALGGGSRGRT